MFFSGLKRLGKFGNVLSIFLAVPFSVYVWNALLSDWFGSGRGGLAPWLIGIVPIAAILLYPLPIMRMKREAVALVGEGDYEGALRISRRWLRSKPYGRPFQGWILLEAGQYSEGQELLKDSAFDEKGMPRLTNVNLFFYAAALLNQGKNAEAQVLLEAAIGVPQKEDYFHSCLAECLLTQNKETNRACEILDSVTKALKKRPNPDQVRAFLSQCIALHAWALASCGRMAEASVRLQDAFEQSCELKKKELAELMHLKGVVCLTLGDREGAKASFRETLALFPHGSTGVLARKRLEGMGEDV
jgi:tetratricopeptide (TPR) repeat protein